MNRFNNYLLASIATLSLSISTLQAASLSDTPWNEYFGASQGLHAWGTVGRTNSSNSGLLARNLKKEDQVVGEGIGLNSARGIEQVADHMNRIKNGDVESFKNEIIELAMNLVQIELESGTRSFWQIGNEIGSHHYSENLRIWANENPEESHRHDPFIIPLYAEYYLAPAVEALQLAEIQSGADIPIMLGSIGSASNDDARAWLNDLLNYQIQGTFAPSLAGQRVYELIDFISIHYLVTTYQPDEDEAWKAQLNEIADAWLGVANIKGIWSTEELGAQNGDANNGAATTIQVTARYLNWWNEKGLSPLQGRCLFWGTNYGDPSTEGNDSMQALFDFLGPTPLQEFIGSLNFEDSDQYETYLFQPVDNPRKRVGIVFPRDREVISFLQELTMASNGWSGAASAEAHVFSPSGHEIIPVTVERLNRSQYRLSLAQTISFDKGERVAVVFFIKQ